MNCRVITFSLLVLAISMGTSCKKNSSPARGVKPDSVFVHTDGSLIRDANGNPLLLRGAAFGNEVYSTNTVPVTHHSEIDYSRLRDMNMNAVRFYLNYRTFESDNAPYTYKQTGWAWIDQNIAWAKKHGIYLILNMHYPQGGYQSQGTGDALWNVVENQNRLAALWGAIAEKYKDEPTIVGYGLVNEPVPVNSLQQWQQLAQKITDEIRKHNSNQIVFVEKPIYIKNSTGEDANLNFPIINDDNVVYEFHYYDPIKYTHQLFEWALPGDGGKYPDQNIFSYTDGTWYTASFNNPIVPPGNSGWTFYEGEKFKVDDEKIKVGLPALVAANVQGSVYFDDIVIKEFDANNQFTGNILELNLNTKDGWSYWSRNNTGTGSLSTETGHGDNASLQINGLTDDGNLSSHNNLFIPVQGHSYQLNGWMKGENVAADASCMLRIDFITTNQPIHIRDKEYLRERLKKHAEFGVQKNLPVYVGEFGTGTPCFANDKGGLRWVEDMLDLLKEYNLHFTYHSYHESSFGIYMSDNVLPEPSAANQELINLFTEKLK